MLPERRLTRIAVVWDFTTGLSCSNDRARYIGDYSGTRSFAANYTGLIDNSVLDESQLARPRAECEASSKYIIGLADRSARSGAFVAFFESRPGRSASIRSNLRRAEILLRPRAGDTGQRQPPTSTDRFSGIVER